MVSLVENGHRNAGRIEYLMIISATLTIPISRLFQTTAPPSAKLCLTDDCRMTVESLQEIIKGLRATPEDIIR